jgi:hypothetical protein
MVQMKIFCFDPLSLETHVACGLETSRSKKFQILALWYAINQEFHADDEDTPELQF